MWQNLFPAVGTLHQLRRANRVVRPAAIAPALAQFSLW
jgi:hypothetical protein